VTSASREIGSYVAGPPFPVPRPAKPSYGHSATDSTQLLQNEPHEAPGTALRLMSRSRTVWIVGEVRTEFNDQCFHRRDCYVLDQVSNRGRECSVDLADLPPNYGPCQICAPGRRGVERPTPQPRTGVQPGCVVVIRNPATGETSEHQIAKPGTAPAQGVVSMRSPLAQALIGQMVGDEVHYQTPQGEVRHLRIVGYRKAD
jgi:Transcription elongation factor, GreA/GreB, C-term